MTKQAGSIRVFIIHIMLATVGGIGLPAYCQMPKQDDREAIERLHQQDVQATLSDSADELAKLWDAGAVRLQAEGPAEVSKSVIYADDKHWQANLRGGKTLSYKPEIKDVQIACDWAFEWGYFQVSYKESANAAPVTLTGKQLRILRRQADGSWKFARVMSLIDSHK